MIKICKKAKSYGISGRKEKNYIIMPHKKGFMLVHKNFTKHLDKALGYYTCYGSAWKVMRAIEEFNKKYSFKKSGQASQQKGEISTQK